MRKTIALAALAVLFAGCDSGQKPLRFRNTASYKVTIPQPLMQATPTAAPYVPMTSDTPPPPDHLGGGWLYNDSDATWVYYPRGQFFSEWHRTHPDYNPSAPLSHQCPAKYRFLGWFTHKDDNDYRVDSLVCIPEHTLRRYPKAPVYFVNREQIVQYLREHKASGK